MRLSNFSIESKSRDDDGWLYLPMYKQRHKNLKITMSTIDVEW